MEIVVGMVVVGMVVVGMVMRWGVGQLKSWLPGEAEAGRDIPLSSRAIVRQTDPPYTTIAPGKGEHSQMGCAVTMAELDRERNGIHRDDR